MADAFKAMGGHIYKAYLHGLHMQGFDRHAVEAGHALWEMDHDPPRVAGGRNTLEGVITKCLGCHKKATKDLARKRAMRRKPRRK